MFSSRIPSDLETNRLTQILDGLRATRTEILDLVEVNPTRAGFSYPSQDIIAALSRPAVLRYDPDPKGLLPARRAVADYYVENHGTKVDPEAVVLASATSEAYSYLFKLLGDPGQEILFPAPGYPLFSHLAELESLVPVFYPLRYDDDKGWRIDLDVLESLVSEKTAAIVVVHPNNPTGSFVKKTELEDLARICEKSGIPLIVDEVFLDFVFERNPQRTGSLAATEKCLCFSLSGLSKISGLPQVKLSWILVSGPADLRQKAITRLEFMADMTLSPSAMAQHAVAELLKIRDSFQKQVRERLARNLAWLRETLGVVKKARVLRVEGGWYAILRVEDSVSEEERICGLLDRDHVLIHPGNFYQFPAEGYWVLSLLTETDILKEGLSRVLHRLRSHS